MMVLPFSHPGNCIYEPHGLRITGKPECPFKNISMWTKSPLPVKLTQQSLDSIGSQVPSDPFQGTTVSVGKRGIGHLNL